jgi:hypothetical protein
MATSGTNTFSVTRDDIIKAALRVLNSLGVGEEPIAEDYQNCSEALNIMIKSWAIEGFPLWVYQTVEVPMLTDLAVYPLGPTAAYVFSVTVDDGGTGYPDTGTVTFSSGAATGTYTAVDGVIQSVTVTNGGNSYTAIPTVTFVGAGTGATGTVHLAGVTTSRPLRIIDAFIRNPENFDTTLTVISQQEYDIYGNKMSLGVPNQIYYDNQLINGNLYVINVPAQYGWTVYLTTQRMFEDMSAADDDFDFPKEWFQALKWGLANELAEEYQAEEGKIMRIQARAEMYLEKVSDWSQEEASVFFSVNTQGTVR